jgi:hypothetical protein
LQSIFSRQIFLLYFGKGKFGGKKFTLQKSEFYFAKEFFPLEKGNFDSLEKEILTVWKKKFDSLEMQILTV